MKVNNKKWWGRPPFPPSSGQWELGRLSTPSLHPTPPATSLAWQPGICRDGRGGEEGSGEGGREPRERAAGRFSRSPRPANRPLTPPRRERPCLSFSCPSLPSHPVSLSFSRNARLNHEGSWWRPNWPLQRSRLFGEVEGGRFLLDFSWSCLVSKTTICLLRLRMLLEADGGVCVCVLRGAGSALSPRTPLLGSESLAGGVILSVAWGRNQWLRLTDGLQIAGEWRAPPRWGLPCCPQLGTSQFHCYNLLQVIALPLHF